MIHTLYEAVAKGNVELIKQAVSCHKIIDENWSDYKLLILSLKHKHREMVELLLNTGCRVQNESKKEFMNSPLYFALKMKDAGILKLLLSKGISFKNIECTTESPFKLILETCNKEITDLILNSYANENISPIDSEGFSPFHVACYIGNLNLVKKFGNCQNQVNDCIKKGSKLFPGYSPLHFAVESRSLEVVQFLIDSGADVSMKNVYGKSSFHLACELEAEKIRDTFMMLFFSVNSSSVQDEGFSVLHKSLFYKHMVHFNISYSTNFNSSWTSWTPLHFAVAQRKVEIVLFLLRCRVDVDAKDELGITPLHLACQCSYKEFSKIMSDEWIIDQTDQLEITQILLDHEANVNSTDGFGKTPIFHVLENFTKIRPIGISYQTKLDLVYRRKELAKLLLKYGAEVNISDKEGVTLLHDLAEHDLIFDENDKIEIADLILSKGANVNVKTKADKTPLFLAIRNKFINLAQVFVTHHADINCTCNIYNQFTPLHTLTYYTENNSNSIGLLNMLLENGAYVNATEIDDATPLHIAIDCHGIDKHQPDKIDQMALALLKYGAEIDARDKNGQTPLHRACLNRYYGGTRVLLEHGADINIVDEFDNTPLSSACYRVQRESNTSFFYIIRQHVNKMKFIGLYVSEKNMSCLRALEKFYAHRFAVPKIGEFLKLCAEEVEKMKKSRLDNYTTLYNIIFKNPNEMVNHTRNDKFLQILKSSTFTEEFQIYGFLLKLQYERGLKREKLIEPAKESFKNLSKCDFPDLCLGVIFSSLRDHDLEGLIKAKSVILSI